MSLAAGALSQISVQSNTAQLSSAVATGGTGPYTYQWYRSTTTGFSPGGGNILTGATSLALNDTGLIPNTPYFYKVVVTDTGNSNVTANSSQLAVTTTPQQLSQNQFSQSAIGGMLDMRFDYNTLSAKIDATQSGTVYPGTAMKIVAQSGFNGVPSVIACTASTDAVFGFLNYDIKSVGFVAGQPCELSQGGNVMYLYATSAITQGAQVTLDVTAPGAVSSKTSNNALVGWAMDGAAAAGALIRIHLEGVPVFNFAP